jgi:hypothetical protein
MAHNALRWVVPALLTVLALLMSGCTTPEIIRETPQPDATATQTLISVESTAEPTVTTVVETSRRTIERIAFATAVTTDGAPEDERSVIPEGAEMFYLCVEVSEVEQGSRFQAIWFEGGEIIGQSEKLALEDSSDAVWMALQYRPIAKLNPAHDHAVELFVDEERIERFVFRVGIGKPADAVAAAAFTTGFDAIGKAINPQTRFHVDTPQLTFRVRISNQVDPAGLILSTLWFRGDTQIAQQAPDASLDDPRRFNFTLTPPSKLPPGNYRVALLLNGTEVRSVPFVMTDQVVPTPAPTPPTATPTTSSTEIIEIVVASRINSRTQAPLDGPLSEWSGTPGGVASLSVAIDVRDVTESDTIEIVVLKDDEYYGSVTLDETELDSGWLAGRVELEVPTDDSTITYTFIARVNDTDTLDTTLELSAQ